VTADPRLELMAPPSLSIVCFRVRPAGARLSDEALDALNRSLLEQLQIGGRAFLSSTVLHGRFVLRACIVNPLSSQADVDAMLDAVRGLAEGEARQA
jgi:glutamate/tyrosine decarboxylase-like PLP-dependent enzyme